jgi:thymidylate synthase
MFVRGKNINEVWRRILAVVWYQGAEFSSERGRTKEILNLMARVESPKDERVEGFPMGPAELSAYAKQLLDPDKKDFSYTYGERLRAWGGKITEPVDQLNKVAELLKENQNTRRATCSTWIPPVDLTESEVPCLILLDFKVREGLLHTTAVFRSNDMHGAWPANAYGLNKVTEYVAEKAGGLSAGPLTTHSISAHIYEHDYKNVKKTLGLN